MTYSDNPMTVEDIQCWISSEMIDAKNDYERYWKGLISNDFTRHNPLEIKLANQKMTYLAHYEHKYETLESIQKTLGWPRTRYRQDYSAPTEINSLIFLDKCRDNINYYFSDLLRNNQKRDNTINALNVQGMDD